MSEIWKKINGYDGYSISSHGRVASHFIRRGSNHTQYDMEISKEKTKLIAIMDDGRYLYTHINRPGSKVKKIRIHRLVLEAFVGNRKPGQVCRHLDGNRLNNRADNLEWGSQSKHCRW